KVKRECTEFKHRRDLRSAPNPENAPHLAPIFDPLQCKTLVTTKFLPETEPQVATILVGTEFELAKVYIHHWVQTPTAVNVPRAKAPAIATCRTGGRLFVFAK